MKTYELIVSGRVQGVGYRFFAQQCASRHHINGNVRNLSNGDVKIIAQCQSKQLHAFVESLQQPQHRWMRIEAINVNEIPTIKEYSNFTIEYYE
ncbi:acylphosphatase [Tuanshanicoccus lijuaniae]|uniref:acylphosphatase n=1 Tax=Aerococcaceae bacterium zg-1292 TaxID=2774330 RepID=UPI0019356100|nr:acylphosphatase [Aerococcaceae bacterium zg-1292]QQA37931.1 acylphosphatase [Aerococcaceae bacterium zg-1292]